jgi:hypothetical protein
MPIRPESRVRYPADWSRISLHSRTERAGGRCEGTGECGRGTHIGRCPNRNGPPVYGTGSTVGCHLHYDRDHHRQTAAATRRAAPDN